MQAKITAKERDRERERDVLSRELSVFRRPREKALSAADTTDLGSRKIYDWQAA